MKNLKGQDYNTQTSLLMKEELNVVRKANERTK